MKFVIKHEIKGRIRLHLVQKNMTYKQADTIQYALNSLKTVEKVTVYERTADVVILYNSDRNEIVNYIKHLHYEDIDVPDIVLESSGRETNSYYWEKIVNKVIFRYASKLFLPLPLKYGLSAYNSLKYIIKGIKVLAKGRIEVPVLDATAIGVSMVRGDIKTAGSIMFLLSIGEILEDWTHKKSVDDLARSMALNVEKAWLKTEEGEILTDITTIEQGDQIVVRLGNIIPFDGVVCAGEAMVNQASLTGESVPVRKVNENLVYAGTVVEEGEITFKVTGTSGSSKFEKIVSMIEESEKLKSSVEGKAEHLADKLVPYTLAGSLLTYLLTRNTIKALSVLMVDFSCALKLSMPITVLSAIREASTYDITVKGGKYLEAMAAADTIVFDKTGTLTKATPTVIDVISFNGENPDELLRIAACLEEHFPHSMAKAVVDAAVKKNLVHEEIHSKVEYLVAHGISTTIEGKKAIIGSYHFVFEDENSIILDEYKEKFENLSPEYSYLYLAIENVLAAAICIADPLREEAFDIVSELKKVGIKKVVMMTGDSERIAHSIAGKVGVDEYYSEVLPEDKASFVEKEKAAGRKVIMIGDGINDSPALSAANVGIAISQGAQIAREIADITIGADNLFEIVKLKLISDNLMKRINRNYREIVGINTGLIVAGVTGVITPTTSAMLHNTSTILISLSDMKPTLK